VAARGNNNKGGNSTAGVCAVTAGREEREKILRYDMSKVDTTGMGYSDSGEKQENHQEPSRTKKSINHTGLTGGYKDRDKKKWVQGGSSRTERV